VITAIPFSKLKVVSVPLTLNLLILLGYLDRWARIISDREDNFELPGADSGGPERGPVAPER
jgi:hypothetical protein